MYHIKLLFPVKSDSAEYLINNKREKYSQSQTYHIVKVTSQCNGQIQNWPETSTAIDGSLFEMYVDLDRRSTDIRRRCFQFGPMMSSRSNE